MVVELCREFIKIIDFSDTDLEEVRPNDFFKHNLTHIISHSNICGEQLYIKKSLRVPGNHARCNNTTLK